LIDVGPVWPAEKKRRVFQGDLDMDKAYIWFVAVGEDAIHHGEEDRGGNFISSRIVEG
jgi:hypothetical protein